MSPIIDLRADRRDDEEAANWIVRINRGLRGSEPDELRNWLAQDDRHRDAFLDAASLWDRMDVLTELADLFPLREAAAARRPNNFRRNALALASLVIAVLAGVLYEVSIHGDAGATKGIMLSNATFSRELAQKGGYKLSAASFAANYSTGIGEQRTVDLPDNSTMQLNSNTVLSVQFTETVRLLVMTRGEASFSVAKDPRRVFTVRVSGLTFNAVGTQFDVRADSQKLVRLTVTEGRVRVHRVAPQPLDSTSAKPALADLSDPTDIELGANRQIVVGPSIEKIEVLEPRQIAVATAWQHGMIAFDETPLADVLAEVSNYTTTRFILADSELGKIRVSGYFKLGDLDAFPAALEHNFNITASKSGNVIVLSARP